VAISGSTQDTNSSLHAVLMQQIGLYVPDLLSQLDAQFAAAGLTLPLGTPLTGSDTFGITDTVNGQNYALTVTLTVTEADGSYNSATAVTC
jgi:hypothetical protein